MARTKINPKAININSATGSAKTDLASADHFIVQDAVTGDATAISASAMASFFASEASSATVNVVTKGNDIDYNLIFATGTTGATLGSDANITYNPSSDTLTAVNVTLSGDLVVDGTITRVDSTNLRVKDTMIAMGLSGSAGGAIGEFGGNFTGSVDLQTDYVDEYRSTLYFTSSHTLVLSAGDLIRYDSSTAGFAYILSANLAAGQTSVAASFSAANSSGSYSSAYVDNNSIVAVLTASAGEGGEATAGDRGLIMHISGENNPVMFWDESADSFAFARTANSVDDATITPSAYADLRVNDLTTDLVKSNSGTLFLGSESDAHRIKIDSSGVYLNTPSGTGNTIEFHNNGFKAGEIETYTDSGNPAVFKIKTSAILGLSGSSTVVSGSGGLKVFEGPISGSGALTLAGAITGSGGAKISGGLVDIDAAVDIDVPSNQTFAVTTDGSGGDINLTAGSGGDIVLSTNGGGFFKVDASTDISIGSVNGTPKLGRSGTTTQVLGPLSGSQGMDMAGTADFGGAVNIQGLLSGSGGMDIAGQADFGGAITATGLGDLAVDSSNSNHFFVVMNDPTAGTTLTDLGTGSLDLQTDYVDEYRTTLYFTSSHSLSLASGSIVRYDSSTAGFAYVLGASLSPAQTSVAATFSAANSSGSYSGGYVDNNSIAAFYQLTVVTADGEMKKESAADVAAALASPMAGDGLQAVSGALVIDFIEDIATSASKGSILSADLATASLSQEPLADSVQVFLNGMLQVASGSAGSIFDYYYTGSANARRVEFPDAIDTDDVIQIKYIKK